MSEDNLIPKEYKVISKTDEAAILRQTYVDGTDGPNISVKYNPTKMDKLDDINSLKKATYGNALVNFNAAVFLKNNQEMDSLFLLPSTTLAALSCELFMKSLLLHYEIPFYDIHTLSELFAKLTNGTKDIIYTNSEIREEEFLRNIEQNKNTFVNVRYVNERKHTIFGNGFLIILSRLLNDICIAEGLAT